jgi:hypothetical protein
VLLGVTSVILYSVQKMLVNTAGFAFLWVTTYNVFVQLDFQEDVAKLTSTSVLRNHAITALLVLIYPKAIGVNALLVMQESIAKKKGLIAKTTRVPRGQCVKMSQATTTTLVCADLVTLETTATLRLTHVVPPAIPVITVPRVLLCNKEDSCVNVYQVGTGKLAKST